MTRLFYSWTFSRTSKFISRARKTKKKSRWDEQIQPASYIPVLCEKCIPSVALVYSCLFLPSLSYFCGIWKSLNIEISSPVHIFSSVFRANDNRCRAHLKLPPFSTVQYSKNGALQDPGSPQYYSDLPPTVIKYCDIKVCRSFRHTFAKKPSPSSLW